MRELVFSSSYLVSSLATCGRRGDLSLLLFAPGPKVSKNPAAVLSNLIEPDTASFLRSEDASIPRHIFNRRSRATHCSTQEANDQLHQFAGAVSDPLDQTCRQLGYYSYASKTPLELVSARLVHEALHFSSVHGDSEAQSKTYMKYVARVLELTTKQWLKTSIELRTRFLSRIEGCIAS